MEPAPERVTFTFTPRPGYRLAGVTLAARVKRLLKFAGRRCGLKAHWPTVEDVTGPAAPDAPPPRTDPTAEGQNEPTVPVRRPARRPNGVPEHAVR